MAKKSRPQWHKTAAIIDSSDDCEGDSEFTSGNSESDDSVSSTLYLSSDDLYSEEETEVRPVGREDNFLKTKQAQGQENSVAASQGMEQSAEQLLSELVSMSDELQEAIIEVEFDELVMKPCGCGREGKIRQYRCYDCARIDVVCDTCLIKNHLICPFHCAERWTGEYFERVDLSSVGYVFYLGHRGAPCPSVREHRPHTILVGHTNGFHESKIAYCGCSGKAKEVLQLMKHGLFPATKTQPETAFTHAVLRAFHIDTIVSKKSGYDYMNTLRKMTNNVTPISIPLHQFMRITHLWSLLCVERWSGNVFQLDDRRLGRPRGSYSIPCLACPIPGFNTNMDPSLGFKNAKFMSIDANFHLIGLRKKDTNNQAERALWKGRGFVMDQEIVERHLNAHGDIKEEKSDCSDFTAIQNALIFNKLKHQGQYASGQVAVLCRHGLIVPDSVVNLQRGERHVNVDLSLSGALKSAVGIPRINLSYDINCQYSKNVLERFRRCFPLQVEMLEKCARYYIGTFHVVGHKPSCQYLYGLRYADGTGRTDGEEVERYWSEMNQVAGSTKQMTPGHRSDTIDTFNSGWNWSKIQTLCDALFEKHRTASMQAHSHSKAFRQFDKALRDNYGFEEVTSWNRMVTEARQNESGEVESVYKPGDKKVPSFQRAGSRLGKHKTTTNNVTNKEEFMYKAIRIEQNQLRLKAKLDESVDKARQELVTEIQSWMKLRSTFMPGACRVDASPVLSRVETFSLWLPSSFTEADRNKYHLTELAAVERRLREGQAYDALANLKNSIRDYEQVNAIKAKFGHGKYAMTRTGQAKANAAELKQYYKLEYQAAYRALFSLGALKTNTHLRELKDEDMYRQSMVHAYELGSGKKTIGWIWTIGWEDLGPDELSHTLEENRVRWFRARAAFQRWKEEEDLLLEESNRLIRGLQGWSKLWSDFSELERKRQTGCASGRSAYSSRKSAIYEMMTKYARTRVATRDNAVALNASPLHRSPRRRARKDDAALRTAKHARTGKEGWEATLEQ